MGWKLVIAEKPSVAQSIAKVIGADERKDGYLEGNGYLVSWCFGHLVELAEPQAYDSRYQAWNTADLPILPEKWHYLVSSSARKQYQLLKKLMERKNVDSLVEATDAGREGELIFRLVYKQTGCRKPFERLWISSMEDVAIRAGFANLKISEEYDALYQSALCRERADWLVGINATRLFSCLYDQTLNIGRVMTPTLALTVQREQEISSFVPVPFYTVTLHLENFDVVSRHLETPEMAAKLMNVCMQEKKAVIEKIETKQKTEKPPQLFDLTSLQREANRVLGFTAKQTLDYLQNLYEKKLVTYPRTDSRYLTDDMAGMLPELCRSVAEKIGYHDSPVVHPQTVINSKKVTDHHAVIPTKTMTESDLSGLSEGEKDILTLVAERLLTSVGDPAQYREAKVSIRCGDELFTAKERAVQDPGWRSIDRYFNPQKDKEEIVLPELHEEKQMPIAEAECRQEQTSPPKHFTEDTLLAAMEKAGAQETPEEAERKGLGTPATRAAIIEKLVSRGFLKRVSEKKVKNLIPTEKGKALITVVPEKIKSPSMTAEWEQKLLMVEQQEMEPETFMSEIADMVTAIVQETEKQEDIKGMEERKTVGRCPCCGSDVVESQKGWFCSNRDCRFGLWKDNAYFKKIGQKVTEKTVTELLQDGQTFLTDCTSQRTGKKYNAILHMTADEHQRPFFHMEFEKREK
jgi:DNA topoisomerase-3